MVELRVVDQRVSAVHEVLDGATVVGVAARYGVSRQTVHRWLRKYADDGVVGLVDGSPVPASCPHQMPAVIEARIIEMRHDHPGWGPRTIGHQLAREGFDTVPGKSSIYRALVRHRLISPVARRRKRADYRRWERARSMELWQMDITGGIHLRLGRTRSWPGNCRDCSGSRSRAVTSSSKGLGHPPRQQIARHRCRRLCVAGGRTRFSSASSPSCPDPSAAPPCTSSTSPRMVSSILGHVDSGLLSVAAAVKGRALRLCVAQPIGWRRRRLAASPRRHVGRLRRCSVRRRRVRAP